MRRGKEKGQKNNAYHSRYNQQANVYKTELLNAKAEADVEATMYKTKLDQVVSTGDAKKAAAITKVQAAQKKYNEAVAAATLAFHDAKAKAEKAAPGSADVCNLLKKHGENGCGPQPECYEVENPKYDHCDCPKIGLDKSEVKLDTYKPKQEYGCPFFPMRGAIMWRSQLDKTCHRRHCKDDPRCMQGMSGFVKSIHKSSRCHWSKFKVKHQHLFDLDHRLLKPDNLEAAWKLMFACCTQGLREATRVAKSTEFWMKSEPKGGPGACPGPQKTCTV